MCINIVLKWYEFTSQLNFQLLCENGYNFRCNMSRKILKRTNFFPYKLQTLLKKVRFDAFVEAVEFRRLKICAYASWREEEVVWNWRFINFNENHAKYILCVTSMWITSNTYYIWVTRLWAISNKCYVLNQCTCFAAIFVKHVNYMLCVTSRVSWTLKFSSNILSVREGTI